MEKTKDLKIELSDTDVINMDDNTGNITVSFIDGVSEGDIIEVHFVEDASDITHKYKVTLVDGPDAVVSLDWIEMQDKTLNEANPINMIKNKIADKKLNKAKKKQGSTTELSAKKLFIRDLKDGEHWRYYIHLPNNMYTSQPLAMRDIKELYSAKNLSPAIYNAVVVTSYDWVVRQGTRDFKEHPIKFDNSLLTVERGYSKDWTEEDKILFNKFLESIKNSSAAQIIQSSYKVESQDNKQTNTQDDKTEISQETQQEVADKQTEIKNSSKENNTVISKNIINKFKKIAMATGLEVFDAFDKPVDMNSSVAVGKINLETLIDYTIKIKGETHKLSDWLIHAVKNKVITESCDINSILLEDLLSEAPMIKLDNNDIMNPSESAIKNAITRAVEQDKADKARKEQQEKESALKTKYQDIFDLFVQETQTDVDPMILLDMLFENLVPPSGAADTQAGELVRAIVRIMYRDSNDGDKFFEGYGIETCGSSAEYLFDHGFEKEIEGIIDNMYQLADDDDKYTAALNHVAAKIVETIKQNPDLIYTPNSEDSRDYSNEYIEEHQARYEYEIPGSDDIITLVENSVLTSWNLNDYVENILSYERVYDGAEVARPWGHHDTSVTVENLTKEGYDYLKDSVEHDLEGFWSDLVNEHADELTQEDEDIDDDYSEV